METAVAAWQVTTRRRDREWHLIDVQKEAGYHGSRGLIGRTEAMWQGWNANENSVFGPSLLRSLAASAAAAAARLWAQPAKRPSRHGVAAEKHTHTHTHAHAARETTWGHCEHVHGKAVSGLLSNTRCHGWHEGLWRWVFGVRAWTRDTS